MSHSVKSTSQSKLDSRLCVTGHSAPPITHEVDPSANATPFNPPAVKTKAVTTSARDGGAAKKVVKGGGKGGGKGKTVMCRDRMACAKSYCKFQHPPGWCENPKP
jgi:hypothetical protein